jgi:hypothetical protein
MSCEAGRAKVNAVKAVMAKIEIEWRKMIMEVDENEEKKESE